ncbi:CPBP family intramembrane glutamic endopeptidase [Nitrospirillum sp. BR 11752]|uniref:CPBP family intramembrane glutamic endopeptidase n=1 Tax=Nitrospirillum sp. BR 11752 TaxID=3104293 RepID=UPI002EC5EC17|nr:CPBP family intramembrane glutamic endopeptidase [Nitrospirillum sp. BR 11752]
MVSFLLVMALALLAVWTPWHVRAFAAFKAQRESGAGRRAFFRRWVGSSLVLFGGGTLAALALLGRLPDLVTPPTEIVLPGKIATQAGSLAWPTWVAASLLAGMVAITAIAGAARDRRHGRSQNRRLPSIFGDVEYLLPRDGGERLWAIVLAMNAGITEEAAFRLLLPLLITLASGDAGLGIAGAALLFGLSHLYLGWRGVTATALSGVALSLIYAAADSLLIPIAVHAAVDGLGLLVLPILAGRRPVSGRAP